jgi:hypothetical protein
MNQRKSHIRKRIKDFISENLQNQKLIQFIKESLVMDTLVDEEEFNELYNGDLELAWKHFVDNQENGDCQGIVASIINGFGGSVKKVFGEIKVDDPYTDEWGEDQTLMTHHWIEIDGKIYDFSKGTLSDYIQWGDIYDVLVYGEEWRYQ